MPEWLKDPITFQVLSWTFMLYTVLVIIGATGVAQSPIGIGTGLVVAALSVPAMLLGVLFTRLWFGLFWRKDTLRSTRAAAITTGLIFLLIGLRFVIEGMAASPR